MSHRSPTQFSLSDPTYHPPKLPFLPTKERVSAGTRTEWWRLSKIHRLLWSLWPTPRSMLADGAGRYRIFRSNFRYSGLERVSDHHSTVHRSVRQILAQKQRAVLRLRGADYEAVPPRQTIAPFDFPGARQN